MMRGQGGARRYRLFEWGQSEPPSPSSTRPHPLQRPMAQHLLRASVDLSPPGASQEGSHAVFVFRFVCVTEHVFKAHPPCSRCQDVLPFEAEEYLLAGPHFVCPTIHQWTLGGLSSSATMNTEHPCTKICRLSALSASGCLRRNESADQIRSCYAYTFGGNAARFSRVAAASCNPASRAPGFQSPGCVILRLS